VGDNRVDIAGFGGKRHADNGHHRSVELDLVYRRVVGNRTRQREIAVDPKRAAAELRPDRRALIQAETG
jgi:hypothetical protein